MSPDKGDFLLEQYKILWDQIGVGLGRRNNWNTIFLTINTVIIGLLAVGVDKLCDDSGAKKWILCVIASAGIIMSLFWILTNWRLSVHEDLRWIQLKSIEVCDEFRGLKLAADGESQLGAKKRPKIRWLINSTGFLFVAMYITLLIYSINFEPDKCPPSSCDCIREFCEGCLCPKDSWRHCFLLALRKLIYF